MDFQDYGHCWKPLMKIPLKLLHLLLGKREICRFD